MISAKLFFRGSIAAAVIAAIPIATPARAAVLAPGCMCPAGFPVPTGPNTCANTFNVKSPAICSAINTGVGHLAASAQQLSFTSVQTILQLRRDQLQGNLGQTSQTRSMITGYAPSEFDDAPSTALSYAPRSDPLMPFVTKAPPAPASSGPSWAAWTQGVGNWERDDPLSAIDVGRFITTAAVQGGVDATWQHLAAANDALVVGVVGSWTGARIGYDVFNTSANLAGPGIGIYSTYIRGGFSVDLTPKVDFLGLTENFGPPLPSSSTNVTNAGVSGNAQYKINLPLNAFVEPTGGFMFTRTLFGANAITLGLEDASTLRLQGGARWGMAWTVNGVSVEPALSTLIYSNVIASNTTNAAAVPAIVPTDQGLVRGELDPSVSLDFGNGYSAAVAGGVRFGLGLVAGAVSVNLRKQW